MENVEDVAPFNLIKYVEPDLLDTILWSVSIQIKEKFYKFDLHIGLISSSISLVQYNVIPGKNVGHYCSPLSSFPDISKTVQQPHTLT